MQSKLGFHIDVVTYPGQAEKIIAAGTRILKVIHTLDVLRQVYAARGDTTTYIARHWEVGDNFLGFGGHINPKAKAQLWFTRMLPHIQQAPFAYWESFNEMDNWDTLDEYGEFEAERQRIMAENGYKCCIGNFAVGGPPINLWGRFYPALAAAHQYSNVLGLHEYGALWADTYYGSNQLSVLQAGQRQPLPAQYDYGWLMFLYRRVWDQHVKPNGWANLKMAITEMGLMSAAPPEINAIARYPVGSWKTCERAWRDIDNRPDTEQYYFEQLRWIDQQMQADPYMLGGTIFTWGTFPDSAWMRDEINGAVADKVLAHIKASDGTSPEVDMTKTSGIDVSAHQGMNLDWQRIADSGVKFTFLRYGVGDGSDNTGKDTTYDRNYAEARKAGILVGAYWYMWATNVPIQIGLVAKLDPTTLDLPFALDVENTAITEANLRLFLSEIKRITGRRPILYTRQNILDVILGTSSREWLKEYEFWIAEYPNVIGDYPTRLPQGVSNWRFWQYSAEGRVPGHTGNIDLNYYNGSLEDLRCRYRIPSPKEFPLRWPVDSPVVTQIFGNNPAYYSGALGCPDCGHEGTDFRAARGANIYACADGVIKSIITTLAYGINVRIDHQNGFESIYAHLLEPRIILGQRVTAGQVIGLADSTGNSSGDHLHLSVKYQNATALGLTSYPNDMINFTNYLVPPTVPPPDTGVQMRNQSGLILNIRQSPSVTSLDLGDIPAGATVTAYPPVINGYIKVLYAGVMGYALAKQFAPVG